MLLPAIEAALYVSLHVFVPNCYSYSYRDWSADLNVHKSVIIIIAINLFVYICHFFMPGSIIEVPDLAVSAFSFYHPWQFITNMFVHTSFWHFAFNMYTLYWFGTALCRMLDEKKFLLIYLVGGVAGALFFATWAWFLSPYSYAIGASGAIFAVGGALAVLQPKMRVMIFPIPIEMPLWVALLGGGVLLSIFLGGVAWQAHLGGIVAGAIIGYIYRRKYLKSFRVQ